MTLEEQIKHYRKQAGLSQEKMAEKIGVSRQAITKWENGVSQTKGYQKQSMKYLLAKLLIFKLGKNKPMNRGLLDLEIQYASKITVNLDI